MTKRLLNRSELRKATDAAETKTEEVKVKAPTKKAAGPKAVGAPKVKKPRKKKEPPRMRARWGVFDSGMKQVAIFDYNQRAAADQKIVDLSAKKNAHYFLQIVKDPMPEPQPVELS